MPFRNEQRDDEDLIAEIERRLSDLERKRPDPGCDCATCCAHQTGGGG